ncbi:MAG TPA: MATE family efflux transporter [Longimicrobiales bacterium]|nr:MATE family efflux transporter [Longimicrobiales bacterium]
MNHPPAPIPGSVASFVPARADLDALVRLAFPVALVTVSTMTLGVVDTIMVGRVSPTDLAAVALGNLYFFAAVVFGQGVLMALDPVISQAMGAGDTVAVSRGLQRGGVLALVLAVLAVLFLLPAGPLLRLLGQPVDVVPVAAGYALVCIPGVLPYYILHVLRLSLQAMGRVGPLLVVVLLGNVANVFFNWVLIYGHLGFPAMGAVGSGWATSLSRWFMALLLLRVSWPLLRAYLRPFRREALAAGPLKRFLRLGAPIGGQQVLEFGVFGAAGLLMGLMGTIPMAGHQVALNLASLTFMVPLGVAQAATVLVGQAVGRGDAPGARRAAGGALLVGVGFMGLTAVVFLVAPAPLAGIYSADASVVALTATLIPIAGVFQVFDGMQVVALGVLRGVADTRLPMVLNLVGFWGIGLPVSAALGFRTVLGPRGIWVGLALGIALVALLLLARVRSRFGRELRRIVLDDDQRHAHGASRGVAAE